MDKFKKGDAVEVIKKYASLRIATKMAEDMRMACYKKGKHPKLETRYTVIASAMCKTGTPAYGITDGWGSSFIVMEHGLKLYEKPTMCNYEEEEEYDG